MEEKKGDRGVLRPLYGIFNDAISSNSVDKMKAAAVELRRRQGEDPEIADALKKLEAAIAKASNEQ